eukprot:jgi/Tetstr1/458768/TSEL_045152.t1
MVSTTAALAAFDDDNTAVVADQPSDDTDTGDDLTLEEEEMLLRGLDSKVWTSIFVGYLGSAPGWMVFNPTTGGVTVNVHVRFLEDESGFAPDPHTDGSIMHARG